MDSFYSLEELKELGLKTIGQNVKISRHCSLYNAQEMMIGNNVRIDDFCILSGKIYLGDYIHISSHTILIGGDEGIVMKDYSGVSSHSSIYAISDDYSGLGMTNPTIPKQYRKVKQGKVILNEHVQVGSH